MVVEVIAKKWAEQNVAGEEQEIKEVVAILSGTGELFILFSQI